MLQQAARGRLRGPAGLGRPFPSPHPDVVASSGSSKPPFTQHLNIDELCTDQRYAPVRIDYLERYRCSGLFGHEFIVLHGIHPDEDLGDLWIRVDRRADLGRFSKIFVLFSENVTAVDTVSRHIVILLQRTCNTCSYYRFKSLIGRSYPTTTMPHTVRWPASISEHQVGWPHLFAMLRSSLALQYISPHATI